MKSFTIFLVLSAAATVIGSAGGKQTTTVGTYTTLSGFYDYQINGGACKYIAYNPRSRALHVVYMSDPDSGVPGNPNRGTYYAYSTNHGLTWNNFLNLRVPSRRSGYPSLDVCCTPFGCCAFITNHNDFGLGLRAMVYTDCPEGGGAFAEFPPPSLFESLQWPQVTCLSNGGVIVTATGSVNGIPGTYVKRIDTLSSWIRLSSTSSGGRHVGASTRGSRVGVLINEVQNGVFLFESTNYGLTWPTTPLTVHPPQRIVGTDTFQAWVGADLAYLGETPVAAISEWMVNSNAPTDSAQIVFWSAATGLVVAADKRNTSGVVPRMNRAQVNHTTLGYPCIALAGPYIAIVYQAFLPETSATGFNYSDIFYTRSVNGTYWFPPDNLTQTPYLDERYPCVSRWNDTIGPYFIYMVWQEDTQPGSAAFNDGAPISRASQKFYRLPLLIDGVTEER
ncbi:MAG: hypothetical protein AAB393_15705, partial [Bacteroidota bacterium]